MVYKLIRLNFGRSPTHFGETGIGLEQTSERIRSDALFSAWISAYARLFPGDIETLLDQCQTANPPFRLSSTFVYRRSLDKPDQFIDYLPKPIQHPAGYPSTSERELKITKTYKKIHYLPLKIWQRWYQGTGFSNEDYDALVAYGDDPDNKINELGKAGAFDYSSAFKRYKLPKVAIDRTTRATNFYHTGLNQFDWSPDNQPERKDGVTNLAGLYFLVDFRTADEALKNKLMAALHLLGEDGIGGERSSGAGRFELLPEEPLSSLWTTVLNPKLTSDTLHHSLISLYWENPVPDVMLGDATCYILIERGGWIASPFFGRQLRRKKVHMFAEGSVFTGKPDGKLADVTPAQFKKHHIYRSGIALSLAVQP
ncbi:type III-A CRISPR-associated RAMP protein Csm4 [Adonisia turfae]|uniref:CRISPR system Cms protein Csm4 n=1 Tax=Adonisia turfae CCMR0081 TaxID=2292702 RepID=A0A6M0RRS9_9CYAN|nr:type III-A CRISPR-associated RAMP protein Csm4 [Adonisia turfae]NEZ58580.1 type III-A CRISPR-associated RAMP protein Csm4 [Adonisia turfae CCMR0081]